MPLSPPCLATVGMEPVLEEVSADAVLSTRHDCLEIAVTGAPAFSCFKSSEVSNSRKIPLVPFPCIPSLFNCEKTRSCCPC